MKRNRKKTWKNSKQTQNNMENKKASCIHHKDDTGALRRNKNVKKEHERNVVNQDWKQLEAKQIMLSC